MSDVLTERAAPAGLAAPLLRAVGISKTYRTPDHLGRLVLEKIDFTLRDGEIVAILGKSGAGKSTFLRILAGLLPPSEGRVEYRGVPVTAPVPVWAIRATLSAERRVGSGCIMGSTPDARARCWRTWLGGWRGPAAR